MNLKLLIVVAGAAAALAVGLGGPASAGRGGILQAQNSLSLPNIH